MEVSKLFTAYNVAPNKYQVLICDHWCSLNEVILMVKKDGGVVENLGTSTERKLSRITHILHVWMCVNSESEAAKLYFNQENVCQDKQG